ncbi:hypothetical protein DFH06DRAFT_1225277 [Mycena polygramma]|nr:hypothetical protein DFH06DRAFT_1225277 [Mycena polygramma]
MSISAFARRLGAVLYPRRYRWAHQPLLIRCYAESAIWPHMFPPQPSPTPGKRHSPLNTLSTLNPALLASTDHLDLSLRHSIVVRFQESRRGTYAVLRYRNGPSRTGYPFPEQCAGFLYYHTDVHALSLEGSVRLRVTPNNEPSAFQHGQDLLLPSGAPWQIALPQIACRKQHAVLSAQLLHENLVEEDHLSLARRLFHDSGRISPQWTLFRLGQQFPIDFAQALKLTAVGKDKLYPLVLPLFADNSCAGSALACFEPSTSAGRRVVHLRIVRIVNPVLYVPGPIAKPEEGQLLCRSDTGTPWTYEIDTESAVGAGLRALWDIPRN